MRSNAAMALCGIAVNSAFGSNGQFGEVFVAVLQALENSEQQFDFSEFKHAAILKRQVNILFT